MKVDETIRKLLTYEFNTILDIGCGRGMHSRKFAQAGKKVTATDYKARTNEVIEGLYEDLEFEQHDAVWCSHVLEHQHNVELFLNKIWNDLKPNGIIAVTVPPLKHEIVGGHVSLWNAGLLLYNLVLNGFDCSNAAIKSYDYNISVIARKSDFKLPVLNHDMGDIEKLKPWLPPFAKQGFNGNIKEWNW